MGTLTNNHLHSDVARHIIVMIILLFPFLLNHPVFGQTVAPSVAASGSYQFSQGGIYVDMSFGEFAVTTINNNDQIITQGFLQPFYIEQPCADPVLVYYPNPVETTVNIKALDCDVHIGLVEVFDLFGKSVLVTRAVDNTLDFTVIGVGVYVVRAFASTGQFIGSMKIVKITT